MDVVQREKIWGGVLSILVKALHNALRQMRLCFEREFHVVSRELFELGRSKVRPGSNLDDSEIRQSGNQTFCSQGAFAFSIQSQRRDLGTATGKGLWDALWPSLM